MKQIIAYSFLLLSSFFYSCHQPVTNIADYGRYIQPGIRNAGLEQVDAEIAFWHQRITRDKNDITAESKLAGLLSRRFARSGSMAELYASDSLYRKVNNLNRNTSSGTFRALAANCITMHRFRQAQRYIDSALALGDDKYLTILQEFDVAMELGNYMRAKQALRSLADKNSFDYLVRESKYTDQVTGDVNAAIEMLERAYSKLPENVSASLYAWIKSNLGDMYGHSNRFREAYKSYLEALEKDPHDYHALKGIAWLSFSHDRDMGNAKKIVDYLKKVHPVPDYELLLAEIAGFENDTLSQVEHRNNFLAAVQNGMYGDMYNKYIFHLQAGELQNVEGALEIAKKEIKNRPSPEAYGWLAWAYCKKGDMTGALQTLKWYVENKCHEPGTLYTIGMIYQAGGNKEMARKYLREAKESSFELGPGVSKEIDKTLVNL